MNLKTEKVGYGSLSHTIRCELNLYEALCFLSHMIK